MKTKISQNMKTKISQKILPLNIIYFCHIYSITKITEIGANLHVIDAWFVEMKSDTLQTHRDHRKFR